MSQLTPPLAQYCPALGYLECEPVSRAIHSDARPRAERFSNAELVEPEDDAAVDAADPASERDTLTVDFSICWSPSFQVPVLWFQVFDRSGAPCTLAEIATSTLFERPSSEPLSYPLSTLVDASRESDAVDRPRPFVSQSEHPVTGRMSWFLHPCETQAMVLEVLSSCFTHDEAVTMTRDEWASKWIETWWMVVASVVNLRDSLVK
ncbi:hypothetical protein JCM11491_005263 [Sporobolomyces phaffii]